MTQPNSNKPRLRIWKDKRIFKHFNVIP
jgi:hypothetical protein